MKKKLLIIICIGLIGCSKENKAKSLIKESLSKSMNDYKSYEPVEYSKLDSSFSYYPGWDYSGYDTMSISSITHRIAIDSIQASRFIPKFNGYIMNHTFRGKNALGALVLNSYRFNFNKSVDSITRVTNIEDEEKERQKVIKDIESDILTVDTTITQ